ncbi:MAG TPA: Uma2 family endonuclease [Kofleriaceae bacterium]|nr:Uma2 family endonuclease [Kofleriaceae bacterium]
MGIGHSVYIAPEWQRRLTVREYHQMIDAGVFDENEHVELLAGVLVALSPHGPRHARALRTLNRLLVKAVTDEYEVLPQLPLTLGGGSEPEPDIAVVRAADVAEAIRHPTTAVLVIEVSSSSLAIDRAKATIYAGAGVSEYWIVDVDQGLIEVYREPDPTASRYASVQSVARGERLSPQFASDIVVTVNDIVE